MYGKLAKTGLYCLLSASLIGCETKAGTGAVVGGAGGALAGGTIGSFSHARAGEGALIGGAIGAIGGALVGHSMDESDKQKNRDAEQDYDRRHRDPGYSDGAVSKNDVIAWSQRGVRDDVIIDRIERSDTVFHLTAADENSLRDHGVSETVLRSMHDTAWR